MASLRLTKRLFILLGVFLLFSACKTADIRTPEMLEQMDAEKGKAILMEMAAAHQIDKWAEIDTYSLRLTNQFFGLLGKFSSPFPKNIGILDIHFIPNTFTSQATFAEGKWKGRIWGIQSWKTYTEKELALGQFQSKNDKRIEFWLPTYQYFVEIPLRILEADVISYAGERSRKGKIYDLVFASWQTAEPQKDIDQYVLWIERDSKQLGLMQYTVRDQLKWVSGTLNYDSYQQIKGLIFPTQMSISPAGPDRNKMMHQIVISNIRIDEKSRVEVMLDPSAGTKGKSN